MKSKVDAVPATQDRVDRIKGRLRPADVVECNVCGRDADESLQEGFEISEVCFVGTYEGQPELCFGVVGASLIGKTGRPWLLGTDTVKKMGVQVIKQCRDYIAIFLERFEYLENYVHVDNVISKRWLKWMGFTIEAAVPYGLKGELFHKFWMRRT